MKKFTLKAFAALVLAAGGMAVYSYSFPPWKPVLYGVSIVLLGAASGLLFYLTAAAKGKKKPAVRGLIGGAAYAAAVILLVLLINNLILKAVKSTLAAQIITAMMIVSFAVLFVITLAAGKKKVFPAVLAVILAAAVGAAPLLPAILTDYRKEHFMKKTAPTGTSVYTEKKRELVKNADFYVSASGDDGADGSFEKPFATIEKARDAVRALDKSGKKGITVAVMAGEYRTSGLAFTAEDSGTEACPVKYVACGDGEVVLNGGVTLSPDSFKAVADESTLGRLSDEAKGKVLCADLKEYGLTAEDWGKLYAIGSYNTAAKYDGDWVGDLYCELFVNDKRQVLARYPDTGYLYTEKVIETGLGRESDGALTAVENWDEIRNPAPDVYEISGELAERISSWKTLDDVWMFGFWKYDWADASSPIGNFDAEKRILSPKFVSTYGTKEDAPYYFYNVFEELDAPGEWYLDRENGIVYVYPDGDMNTASVDLSVTLKPIISVDGADYITFDGFTVKGTRGDAVIIKGNNNTVENCLIKNVAGWAMSLSGYNNLAYANEITRTGKGGISLDGGDRETLTPGNNKADNNYIHDWSEIYQTYQAACSIGGVGNICSHNEMHDSPHEAITYGGNNNVIEYNLIHDVCLLTDDGGAIYAGRRWDFYGNVIRYNCIYDLGSGEHKPDGIYMDDALSGQTIYGNLLVNVPKLGLHLGGGRDLDVRNNVVINSGANGVSYDDRARQGVFGGWFTHSSQEGGDMWTNLFDSPWQTELWKKTYPQMTKFSDDFDNTDAPEFVPNPAFSTVNGNVFVNVFNSIGNISDSAARFSDISGNAVYKLSKLDKLFADPENGDYSVPEDSDIFKTIPGFEQIPINEIGRY